VLARRFWSDWKKSLLLVAPETVVRWHRAGFRLYWSMLSKIRKRAGRRRISREARDLIFRMVAENPTWGAPRIHGELLMLGFDVSERSVSRCMKRAPRDRELARRWLASRRHPKAATHAPRCTLRVVDLAAGVVQNHDQVIPALVLKPLMPAAINMQQQAGQGRRARRRRCHAAFSGPRLVLARNAILHQ
jgi:hypothetical protein